jgi:hypothetical protein
MKKNSNVDFYRIDSLMTAEEKAVKEQVRQFVDRECMPVIADHFDKGGFYGKSQDGGADITLSHAGCFGRRHGR